MSVVRVINRVIWTLVGIAVNVGTGYQWAMNDCGVKSVVLAAVWYSIATYMIWKVIDLQMEEAENTGAR